MLRRRQFRYETLLRVRRLHEERQAQRLAAVRRDMHRAILDREFIAQEQIRILDEAGAAASEEFDAAQVQRYYNYERHLARLAVERDAQIAALRRTEKERLGELEYANKRKRVVERLREHHEDAVRDEFGKEEQKSSDNAAVSQAAATRIQRRAP